MTHVKHVMLDSDLAKLYQVETKRVNEAVKNNPEKHQKQNQFKKNWNRQIKNSIIK